MTCKEFDIARASTSSDEELVEVPSSCTLVINMCGTRGHMMLAIMG